MERKTLAYTAQNGRRTLAIADGEGLQHSPKRGRMNLLVAHGGESHYQFVADAFGDWYVVVERRCVPLTGAVVIDEADLQNNGDYVALLKIDALAAVREMGRHGRTSAVRGWRDGVPDIHIDATWWAVHVADELAAMPPVVVTRHGGLVKYLRDEGLIPDDAEVVAHATAEAVKGRRVWGVLPHSLSCLTASFSEVPLDLPAELRGKELSAAQVAAHAGVPVTYKVAAVKGAFPEVKR
jgi:putative CRISPR-associated protein (TIGR02620 family)